VGKQSDVNRRKREGRTKRGKFGGKEKQNMRKCGQKAKLKGSLKERKSHYFELRRKSHHEKGKEGGIKETIFAVGSAPGVR